ncbi:MAG: enoyl-[acyl-carrier protein] reductase II [Planctomycetota bacterium]|jgi:enoyl-[acyl-carrier protein] reductase II
MGRRFDNERRHPKPLSIHSPFTCHNFLAEGQPAEEYDPPMKAPSTHPAHDLCEKLGISIPVVQGGMTFGSDGRLVAAVSEAGGLGTLGTFHYRTYEKVMVEVQKIRAATDRPFAVNVPFFENNLELVDALATRGGVKIFALGGWFSEEVEALKEKHGLTILVSVNSPTVARMVEERPIDVLIVQGNESGGANSHFTTRQLFDLISPTIDAPVLLAGGQWDGADLMRAMQLGAAGIQLGTRFFFSEESPLNASIKDRLLNFNQRRPLTTQLASVSSTLNMRFVQNKPFSKAQASGLIKEVFQDKEKVFALSEAFYEHQDQPILIYAGAGLYKLNEIQPSAAILAEILSEYHALAGVEAPQFV